jgi:hypothetical protein
VILAGQDNKPARKSTYLAPVRRFNAECRNLSLAGLQNSVERLGGRLASARMVSAPYAAAAAALSAASADHVVHCTALSDVLWAELGGPRPHTKVGWAGYAGTVAAWNKVHDADRARAGEYLPRRQDGDDAYRLSGAGRVFTLAERFSPPVTSQLALASIERSLLPGKVHVAYALKAAQCQQAIFMGPTLGKLFGNSGLGAFVELSSGKGVGHTPYDADQVDRARITPLGKIGGEPCT